MLKTSSLLNILKITMVYFSAHYLLLFVSGIWWDDWVLHDLDLFRLFDMQGSFFLAYIHEFLFLLGDNGYRILTFFIYWCSSIIYYKILQEFSFISTKGALWMSMIFACLPLNDARITQICFFYGLSLLCFLLGFLLIADCQPKRTLVPYSADSPRHN